MLKDIIRTALVVVLLILSLEAGVRVAAFLWLDHGEYYFFYGFHNLTGNIGISPWWTHSGRHYKFPPHYLLKGAAGQDSEIASINSLGFRGPEFQPAKPPGVFRIICMGESSTFGYRNTDTGTYPFFLESILSNDFRASRIEVINAGFPYYNTGSILSLLQEDLLNYRPDLLTLYSAFNDTAWPLEVSPVNRAFFWIQEHSAIYLAIKDSLHTDTLYSKVVAKMIRKITPERVDYTQFNKDLEQVTLRYRKNVQTIVRLAKANAILIILIKQPMTTEDTQRRIPAPYEREYQTIMEKFRRGAFLLPRALLIVKHHRLIEELEKIAKEEQVPVVDNIAIVDQDRRRLASWVHLTEEANLRLAEALTAQIKPYLVAEKPTDPKPKNALAGQQTLLLN
ncbi:MAG TPA: GDSL-type esterase/lipase family protein [Candidatus Binatia bacterium]|nr:GDSL-type esterase/lipase family protein [Candidatus Binatia bacterium]